MSSISTVTVPPGPKGIPILGSLNTMRNKGIFDFHIDLWREYGDTVQVKLGPITSIIFTRAEHIQYIMVQNADKFVKGISHEKLRTAIGDGILTLEGERWYTQHKLMQPTYTRKNVAKFAEIMQEESQKMLERWDALQPRSVVDINQEMTRVTMSVIMRSIFNIDVSENVKEAIKALHNLLEYTSRSTDSIIDVPLFVPTPANRLLKRSRAIVTEFIQSIIAQRRREGLGDDLLSLLMSARDADTGEPMSNEQIENEILITIFAGHETTASLLTWGLYALSLNPEAEARLHNEVDSIMGGRPTTTDDMPKLTYTRMILDETLRLYSPVPIMARDAMVADEIGGYAVPKGTLIILMPYGTHRSPDYWEKPLEFYPEHFLPAAVESRPRYAYLPFGAGQRICLGMHFALLEATLILGDIAQRYQPRLAVPFDGKVKYIGVVRPVAPIMLRLDKRDAG